MNIGLAIRQDGEQRTRKPDDYPKGEEKSSNEKSSHRASSAVGLVASSVGFTVRLLLTA
jgi:hypothetical protein